MSAEHPVVSSEIVVHEISLATEVEARLPGVHVWGIRLSVGHCTAQDWQPEIDQIHQQWSGKSRSEVLNAEIHKHYAAFMRAPGINSKKQPPSVANLIIRCFTKPEARFPQIHPVVDAVNIAALQTGVSLGVFDAACVTGTLQLAFSAGGESFLALGADEPDLLEANKLVLRDDQKVLSLFSVRDSQAQAISSDTRQLWLLGCQVPGIDKSTVLAGLSLAVAHLQQTGAEHAGTR